jgi:hypothetical protein
MTAFTRAEHAYLDHAQTRIDRAYERGERFGDILEELLNDPEQVEEALLETPRATEMVIAILQCIPSITDSRSANVDALITFCRGLEAALVEPLMVVAQKRLDREDM